jgi:MoaA/NifB/PqqE/SkfB family radical SAM enzyme
MIQVNPFIFSSYSRGSTEIAHDCDRPFKTLTVNLEGNCFLCICDAWLPVSVGNVLDFESLSDIWNNPIAQKLQQTVKDRKFTYCAVDTCGVMDRNITTPDYRINFAIDDSCNLACPSCRVGAINYIEGPVFERKLAQVKHFVKLINEFTEPMSIVMTGNGDPLASLIMRPLVLNWKPKSNQSVILFTNGLLMKKLLPDSGILPNIQEFLISVDAGSKEVYEVVRRPGRFDVLRDNLNWLSKNRRPNTNVLLKFVLQSKNFNDLENFSNMCLEYGFLGEVTKIDKWNIKDFDSHDVIGNKQHPNHELAVQKLLEISTYKHITIGSSLKQLL